jgi:hypothetical protein
MKCIKACCKGKGKAKDRRVKIVTSTEVESTDYAEAIKSAGDETTASTQSSPRHRKNKEVKGKAVQVQSETEDESSAKTGKASTDLDTAVKYTNPSVNDPSWSISEDYRLRGMKEAGETWNFIAGSLCKSKNDVRARWEVLQSQTVASETSTEPETGGATTEPETGDATGEEVSEHAAAEVANYSETTSNNNTDDQDEESEETSENGIELEDCDNDGDDETDQGSDNDDADEKSENTEEETNFISKSKGKALAHTLVNNKWHSGTRNRKVAIENKLAKARAKAKAQEHDDSSMESGQGASGNTSESSCLGYGDPERHEQMKYLQDHIYGEMYPADIHPNPDAYLSRSDCALLATIDSKYKRSRWLEMQANFFNVTGRMVPLEALRDRCEGAEAEKEAEKEARSEARKLKKYMDRIGDWVEDQAHEVSEE